MESTVSKIKPAASRGGRRGGPRVAVELPVASLKKTLNLKETTLKLLADYAAFLSTHHGQKVDEDLVVDSLVQRLAGDRAFALWQKGQGRG